MLESFAIVKYASFQIPEVGINYLIKYIFQME